MTPRGRFHQLSLFTPPAIARPAQIATGTVFMFGGRSLRVHRIYGTDARAPVIVEELAASGNILKGQYALWSVAGVTRAMAGGSAWRT